MPYLPDQAKNGGVQLADNGFQLLALRLALFKQVFFMFTGGYGLEGCHHTEEQVGKVVLNAEKLVCHKGGGMDIPVCF